MENLIINFCHSSEEQEIKLANIDKLKLLLCLCRAKFEKEIHLPFTHLTVIGTDYIAEEYEDLIRELYTIARQSRKIGLSFTIWEKESPDASDFESWEIEPKFLELIYSDKYLKDWNKI